MKRAATKYWLSCQGKRRLPAHVHLNQNVHRKNDTHPMKALSTVNQASRLDLLDYTVVDQNKENIGTLHSMWNNQHTNELEFLGLKTGWLFGSNHVVPADNAQVDEATRTIQVPYTLALIKDAPSMDADSEISDEQEAEIYRYYGGTGRTASTTQTTATRSTGASLAETAGAAATGMMAQGTTARDAKLGDDREITLSEEQVKVGKRTVDAGAVRLRKIVRTEIVNQPVEIRHEDVVVERITADKVNPGTAASDFKEETIDVPLTREEAVVSKEAHVTGAVRVNKTSTAETQNVSETVRKEDVEVLRDGKTVTEQDGSTRH